MTDLFFAEATNSAGLRDALRARVEQLNISRQTLDEVTGLPSGFTSKLLSQGEAKDRKRIGPLSLDLLLPATGLKLVLVDDRDALAKIEPQLVQRDASQVRLGNISRKSKGRRKPRPAAKRPTKKAIAKRGKPYLSR